MGDWKVTGDGSSDAALAAIATGGMTMLIEAVLGPSDKTYTVENQETGETKQVVARDETELGQKIAKGEFEK